MLQFGYISLKKRVNAMQFDYYINTTY